MKVLIFGASGMVGIEVLFQTLEDPRIDKVVSIGRSKMEIGSEKLTQVVHHDYLDYSDLQSYLSEADVCFYCLGVYQTKVSKDIFWKITVSFLESLVNALSKINPNIRFCLFSAQGASPEEKSLFLFGNAKGRAEKRLTESGIRNVSIFRPGFINPGRKAAFEGVMLKLYKAIYKLFPSIGIDAPDLANAMIRVGLEGGTKTFYENSEIRMLSANRVE